MAAIVTKMAKWARGGSLAVACAVSVLSTPASASVPETSLPPRVNVGGTSPVELHENVMKGLMLGALGVGIGASSVVLVAASPALAVGGLVVGTAVVAPRFSWGHLAGRTGLEPAPSGVTGRRYYQLNYYPVLRAAAGV